MRSSIFKPRTRKCASCRNPFLTERKGQKVCGPDCGEKLAKAKREKEQAKREREEFRKRKDAIKPLSYFLKRAQNAVNKYVQLRDREHPCISCGTWDSPEWHAGHFVSVGASSALRFDPANIHRQCAKDNVFLGGNQTNYEIRLIAKIGPQEVERLKTAQRLKVWTREELGAIYDEFRARIKEFKD